MKTIEARLKRLEEQIGINEAEKQEVIFVKTPVDAKLKVLVVTRKVAKQLEAGNKMVHWTTDNSSEVGEEVVIENTIGLRASFKRVS